MTTMPRMPKDVDAVRGAFPANVTADLLPKWEDIPEAFKKYPGGIWNQLVTTWFFLGIKNVKWTPKPGVDTKKALAHVGACMRSWEPKHEHKEAGCAFLLSEFFEDVTYDRCEPKKAKAARGEGGGDE